MFADFYHSYYYLSLMAAALCGLIFISRADPPFKWLALLLMLTLGSELVAKYISHTLKRPNNAVYHVFTIMEYLVYTRIYSGFFRSARMSKYLLGSAFLLITAEIINILFFQPIDVDNTNTMIVESLFLILISLILFNKIKEEMQYADILRQGVFWFNAAVLFYYSFDILIWGFHGIKVYQLKDPPMIIYNINFIISGLLYLVYSFSICLHYFNNKKSGSFVGVE